MKTYGWPQSATFRMLARGAIRRWNAGRHLLPKCGAKAKHSGDPCRQIAMANGRCHFHGGRTPRGDAWHRLQPSNSGRKVWDAVRAAERRAQRLAAMTPEQRAAHAEWQRTHKPGPPGPRAAAREWRQRNLEACATFAAIDKPRPVSQESRDIAARIEELHRQLATLCREGVFG